MSHPSERTGSTGTEPEVERRLREALAARAEQVGPADLGASPLPAVGRRRRGALAGLVAAAACLAAIGVGLAVVAPDDPDGTAPQPAPSPDRPDREDPEVVVPPDVGADWPRARLAADSFGADLDGDGVSDEITFRGEPDDDFAGRLRLDVRLSGGGAAYGVVDLGSTLTLERWQPTDLDDDGAQELVLGNTDESGQRMLARVLDLRDGVLVEAPPAGGGLLPVSGQVPGDGGTADYDLARAAEWWTDDGGLRSSVSASAYPALGMDWFVPTTYVADSWSWRIDDEGILRPTPVEQVCVDALDSTRRACEPGETDALPETSPVVGDLAGAGESFELDGALPVTVTVEATGEGTSVAVDDGTATRTVELDGEARVFTEAADDLYVDGTSLAYDDDGDDRPDGLVLVEGAAPQVLPAPEETTTWLTAGGAVLAITGPGLDDGDPTELTRWARDGDRLVAVPLGTVCLPDADPAQLRRC